MPELMLSVVVPMHNEADGVEPLARQLAAALAPWGEAYEVVIVEDGSTDDTWARLQTVAARDPRWRIIRFARNFGQTPAMQCGIAASRGRVLVTMDGDLQNDPADIPQLVRKLDEGYDVVCGWRHQRQDKLWTRKVPSMVANRLIGWLNGVRLHDYGCSLKAYRADAIKRTPLYAEFHRFIPALSTLTGAVVAEVRVNHRPRTFGRTKYNLSRTWRVALDMVTIALLVKFAAKPLRFFGALALVALAAAGACLLRSWFWYAGPYHRVPQILPAVSVLGVWLAGHLVIVGFIAELLLATAHGRPEQLVVIQQGKENSVPPRIPRSCAGPSPEQREA